MYRRKQLVIDRMAQMQITDGQEAHVSSDNDLGMTLRQDRNPRRPLDRPTVRLRWLTVGSEESGLARWRSMLDDQELARADRYHFSADRDIYIAARALARFMLSEATGMPTSSWRYFPRGVRLRTQPARAYVIWSIGDGLLKAPLQLQAGQTLP
jgi:hypothetical protein